MTPHFADSLMQGIITRGSRLCVGLDPQTGHLPAGVDVETFCRGLLDAVRPYCACVKPNAAFFEALGPRGLASLWRVCEHAQELGLPVILDAKRGDIGSTAAAYAQAYLAPGTPFDALTVNPYLGSDGVAPFIEVAAGAGKGLFVLVKTSNPSSGELQDLALADGSSVYRQVGALVGRWGEPHIGASGYSCVGAVTGATYPAQLAELRAMLPATPFLVPGYGAQGAGAADVAPAFDASGLGAIVNSSRGIIYAYEQPACAGLDFAEAAAAAASRATHEINLALGRAADGG